MKLKKQIVFSFIIITLFYSIISNQQVVNAATPVSISLEYSWEEIPENIVTSGWNHVYHGEVLYKVAVKATVYGGGYGIIGKYLNFSNPNTSKVKYIGRSGSIDYNGYCTAYYEVRGTTTFNCSASINDGIYTGSGNTSITPVEGCYYDSDFLITYYVIADEVNDYTGQYNTSMSGVSGLYKSAFVADVKVQGSGYSHNNQYIKYLGNNQFTVVSYPTTASGTYVAANKTIAVDNYYIPRYNDGGNWLRAKVKIFGGVGDRQAEDAGGAINNWHIDVFTGIGRSSGSWAEGTWNMTEQWVYYYGNNKW